MNNKNKELMVKTGQFVVVVWIFYNACLEVFNVAWGTGQWWGEFSPKWAGIFILFTVFCLFCLFFVWFALWRDFKNLFVVQLCIDIRKRMGLFCYILILLMLLLPIWLFQYSFLGLVFNGPYLRLLVWSLVIVIPAFLLTSEIDKVITWPAFLKAAFLSALDFCLAVPLAGVTNYPFSLGWSEGNRMWDYSLLFGSDIYKYSSTNPPSAYLDLGRQLGGGFPFLLPHLSIFQERLWLAIMMIIPYVVLGIVAFFFRNSASKWLMILAGLWAWMFLDQGPIHAPLLWSAICIALAWKRPLWIAIPLTFVAGVITTISRSTWVFAPAMWIGVLELCAVTFDGFNLRSKIWLQPIGLVFVGLAGGPFLGTLTGLWNSLIIFLQTGVLNHSISLGSVTVASVTTQIADQPLLWYRLLPNATYGDGILIGLIIATLPAMVLLVHLNVQQVWILNFWQSFVLLFALFAFLAVGLIVSTKIGGGGDLHNMDMFLIGVMFAVALAWMRGGYLWMQKIEDSPQWIRFVFLLMIAIPGFQPLMSMRPISFHGNVDWLATLSDAKSLKSLGLLPSDASTSEMLQLLKKHIQDAQTHGDVLFMDQRQLLTFGYIKGVNLVPEYEKKLMMDKALSNNDAYFAPFYRDLAAHRFSLIISDPLRTPIKDSDYQFGEENNAWVKWISNPILCYYDPILTKPEFRIQLLVPKKDPSDCSQYVRP